MDRKHKLPRQNDEMTSNYSKVTFQQFDKERPKQRVIFHDGSNQSMDDMDTQYGVQTQYGADPNVIDRVHPYSNNAMILQSHITEIVEEEGPICEEVIAGQGMISFSDAEPSLLHQEEEKGQIELREILISANQLSSPTEEQPPSEVQLDQKKMATKESIYLLAGSPNDSQLGVYNVAQYENQLRNE